METGRFTYRIKQKLEKKALSSGYPRTPFDKHEFFGLGQHVDFELLYVGANHATDPINRVKYIDHSVWPVDKSELMYHYLDYIVKEQADGRKLFLWNKRNAPHRKPLLDIVRPLWTAPRQDGDFAYLDIDRAHFQVMVYAGLDVAFHPAGRYLRAGKVRFLGEDWLEKNGSYRHVLSGLIRKRTRVTYRYGDRETPDPEFHNPFLAPCLWGLIQYTLHYAAFEMLANFDVLYWNTDGMILPWKQLSLAREYLWEEWSLQSSLRYEIGENRLQGNRGYGAQNNLLGYEADLAQIIKNFYKRCSKLPRNP